MKENIERIVKEQLEHYELPYEAGAWEAMSRRLDGTPSTPFYRKWWFAATVGTILVGSAAFFTLTNDQSAQKKDRQQLTAAADPATAASTKNTAVVNAAEAETATTTTPENEMRSSDGGPVMMFTPPVETDYPDTPTLFDPRGGLVMPMPAGSNGNPSDAKLSPVILPASVCQNEPFTIENPNSIDLQVKLPGGMEHVIPGKKSLQVTASEAGTITVRSGKIRETITVNAPASRLYIDADVSVLYENGIPTVKFEASGAESEVSWESNVAARSIDKNKLVLHPFKEKRVDVTASSTDQNGCVVTEKKTIYMQESYNLIAMEAFRPLSDISENRLFMPFALTLREAPFELTIFDPKTGAPVYKTNDPAAGWDGTDKRNGEMVPANSIWSWKVVMKNPLPGEQNVYSGTVTRL